ncbi:hypothetical protein Hanom_Chr02g00174711 [Helianthus anomalus]
MKFPLQCFSKVITGTTGLLTAPDSVQGGVGGRDNFDLDQEYKIHFEPVLTHSPIYLPQLLYP